MSKTLRQNSQQCWRCGGGHPLAVTPIANLVGGYKAHLCAECTNDWHILMLEFRPYLDLCEIELAVDIEKLKIIHDGDPEAVRETKIQAWAEEQNYLKRVLFEKAETWIALGLEPPKKES